MSLATHILPTLATIVLWFASTALIVWLANRPRDTFRRSLGLGGVAAVIGLVLMVGAAGDSGDAAAYASFAGALAIWGWHELAFLTGAVTGPRRAPLAPGGSRFADATATVIHHELALAATAVLLLALTWGAPNAIGAYIFALLFVLRLGTKLAIFAGVPSMSDELLPAHLGYLKSYFGPPRFSATLALALAGAIALTLWLGARAMAAPSAGGALLFALAALGAIEHLFLALPLRDGALWRWANPARRERVEA